MTSPPHHTGRFIDAVPSDQLQIAGEPAESSGLHEGTGNTGHSISQTNVMNRDESANLHHMEVDASTQQLTQVNAESTNVHQQQYNAIQRTANVVYTHDPQQIERLIQAHVAAALSEQRQQLQGEAMQMAFSAKDAVTQAEREKQQTQVQAKVGVARIHQEASEAIQKRDQQIAELMGQLEQAKGQIEQLNVMVHGSQSACAGANVPPAL